MANHKRKKPKSGRAGCLLCKPWKHQRARRCAHNQRRQEQRAAQNEREQRNAAR